VTVWDIENILQRLYCFPIFICSDDLCTISCIAIKSTITIYFKIPELMIKFALMTIVCWITFIRSLKNVAFKRYWWYVNAHSLISWFFHSKSTFASQSMKLFFCLNTWVVSRWSWPTKYFATIELILFHTLFLICSYICAILKPAKTYNFALGVLCAFFSIFQVLSTLCSKWPVVILFAYKFCATVLIFTAELCFFKSSAFSLMTIFAQTVFIWTTILSWKSVSF